MAKANPMLARIEARAEAKYAALFHAKLNMLLQMGQDAAMIAANEVFHMGASRAVAFCNAYTSAVNEIAHMVYDDQMDDPEFVWAKSKVDERIKNIVGEENFVPWEVRYKIEEEKRGADLS